MGIEERKEKERQIRRNDIISAAGKVFMEKGFEYATMEDIAKEAEFTKKTLYSYFRSKEELYFEIMLKGFRIINNMCDEKLKEMEGSAESDKIKALGMCFIDFKYQYPGYFKAIMDYQNRDYDFEGENEETIIGQCYKEGEHTLDMLRDCVISGIQTGEFLVKADPAITVLTLWSYLMGLISLIDKKEKYISKYYNETISEVVEESFEIIINSIKVK